MSLIRRHVDLLAQPGRTALALSRTRATGVNRGPYIYRAGKTWPLRLAFRHNERRLPVLAVGSNAYPRTAVRQTVGNASADLQGIPTVPAILSAILTSATVPVRSRKGYVPVTLASRPGAVCLTWLQWLTLGTTQPHLGNRGVALQPWSGVRVTRGGRRSSRLSCVGRPPSTPGGSTPCSAATDLRSGWMSTELRSVAVDLEGSTASPTHEIPERLD